MVRKKPRIEKAIDIIANNGVLSKDVVVIDAEGINLGRISREAALELAKEQGLDLIQVSPEVNGACTAILGLISKYRYEKQKKLKKNKSTSSSEQKEWWFKVNIQERDVQIKLLNVKEHLDKGGVAKLTIKFVKKSTRDDMEEAFALVKRNYEEFAKPINDKIYEGKNISITIKLKK